MEMYKIIIGKSALKQLQNIPEKEKLKISAQVDSLAGNPRPQGVKKLKGITEDLYRIRSGNYRIVYSIEDKIRLVDIRQIGNRKDIYR
jgi:mRNA interferase RelE/StbE